MSQNAQRSPIGVFDSGIGGLSVANAIYSLLPMESIIYYADTGHVPYGPRSKNEITSFSKNITAFLLDKGCKIIVVACNTATTAAIEVLRKTWPAIHFVGMEPAVKPAAEATKTGVVGVLATASTIQSQRYFELMNLYASNVKVLENPCVGLVPLIEAGKVDSPEAFNILNNAIQPMLAKNIDTLVLGCTHYPFVRSLIDRITNGQCEIIDPAPAIARQTAYLLEQQHLLAQHLNPQFKFTASGQHAPIKVFSDIPFEKI